MYEVFERIVRGDTSKNVKLNSMIARALEGRQKVSLRLRAFGTSRRNVKSLGRSGWDLMVQTKGAGDSTTEAAKKVQALWQNAVSGYEDFPMGEEACASYMEWVESGAMGNMKKLAASLGDCKCEAQCEGLPQARAKLQEVVSGIRSGLESLVSGDMLNCIIDQFFAGMKDGAEDASEGAFSISEDERELLDLYHDMLADAEVLETTASDSRIGNDVLQELHDRSALLLQAVRLWHSSRTRTGESTPASEKISKWSELHVKAQHVLVVNSAIGNYPNLTAHLEKLRRKDFGDLIYAFLFEVFDFSTLENVGGGQGIALDSLAACCGLAVQRRWPHLPRRSLLEMHRFRAEAAREEARAHHRNEPGNGEVREQAEGRQERLCHEPHQ